MTRLGATRNPPLDSLQKLLHPLGATRYTPVKSHRFTGSAVTTNERLQQTEIKPGTFSLAICDLNNHCIFIYDPATDHVVRLAGRMTDPPVSPLFEFDLSYPRDLIPHPFIPGALFVSSRTCVYLIDVAADLVSVYAGTAQEGYAEGERTKSQWSSPLGMAALDRGRDGKSFWTLYVCDRYVFAFTIHQSLREKTVI